MGRTMQACALGKGIGLGYVTPNCGELRTTLGVKIRSRTVGAEVVPLPFYRRPRPAGAMVREGNQSR